MQTGWALALFLGVSSLTACGGLGSHVRVDDVALGRVVIYRNGVAYYERRAQVQGSELVVTVPQDKVDDFLKSLTVVDRATGEPLPASFPRHRSAAAGMIDMTIQLPRGKAATDVVLTYVTGAPAWKPTYRVVVGDQGKVLLQGWAIVDNTSGEDWRDVLVGVGSSSALSFRYDLWSIRDVHRAELAQEQRFAAAPPTGVSPHSEVGKKQGEVLTRLSDDDIPAGAYTPDGVTLEHQYVQGAASGGETIGLSARAPMVDAPSSAGSAGSYRGPSPEELARQRQEMRARASEQKERRERNVGLLTQQITGQRNVVVLEGYADAHEQNPEQRALERANALRNELIENGVPPAQLEVVARGAAPGESAGVKVVVGDEELPVADDPASLARADAPVGESHFQSEHPMNVERGSSVMVSMVKRETEGEVVYLYDPESARGHARYAFKAVRFRNPTDSTLETGPLTVYGEGRFIGEGLAEPIPPAATAVVPFALDRQVVVSRDADNRDQISRLVTLDRGVLTANVQHVRATRLKLTNRLNRPTAVFVRHTVAKGWQLTRGPEVFERVGGSHLFLVQLDAGETRAVTIEEATPMLKTIDLHTRAGLDLVTLYLEGHEAGGALAARVDTLLDTHRKIADTTAEIDSVHERLAHYRVRMDELHNQLVELKKSKASGKLLRHLEQKLEDVSGRVHQVTVDLVTLEERLMLANLQFRDGVAGLDLPDKLASH